MEIEDDEAYRDVKTSKRKIMKLGEFKDLEFIKLE